MDPKVLDLVQGDGLVLRGWRVWRSVALGQALLDRQHGISLQSPVFSSQSAVSVLPGDSIERHRAQPCRPRPSALGQSIVSRGAIVSICGIVSKGTQQARWGVGLRNPQGTYHNSQPRVLVLLVQALRSDVNAGEPAAIARVGVIPA